MRYRVFSPQCHLFLDAPVAAVLLTILGPTLSYFIQALVDSVFILERKPSLKWFRLGFLVVILMRVGFSGLSSYLSAHLSRRIDADIVAGCRRLPGLPLVFISLFLAVAAGTYVTVPGLSVPPPEPLSAQNNPVPIVIDIGGRVKKVYIAEGSSVRLGDPIVQLDTDHLTVKRHTVESQIHATELGLNDRGSKLSKLYDELHLLQVELGHLTITSPGDGEISSIAKLYAGQVIEAGEAVAVLYRREIASR